jgi:hypothetical protein
MLLRWRRLSASALISIADIASPRDGTALIAVRAMCGWFVIEGAVGF